MNGSIVTADATTHVKILAVSLLASILVVWVGISAHSTTHILHRTSLEVLDATPAFPTPR